MRQLANAFASLWALQQTFGATLPIEIWHRADEVHNVNNVSHLFQVAASADKAPCYAFADRCTFTLPAWGLHGNVPHAV